MTDPLLSIRGLRKSFGGFKVTDDVDLDVIPSQIHALIGPNGAGKSTLIGQITGDIHADRGEIRLLGRNVTGIKSHERVRLGIVRSFQISSILPEMTVLQNVLLAAAGPRIGFLNAWRAAESLEGPRERAMRALERVGLAARAATSSGTLSYGERRHLEIAMALVLSPKVLLLDEPMAGVGPSESRALTQLLAEVARDCSIVLVEHDMDVVFALANQVSVLVAGRIVASGAPADVRGSREVQAAYFGEEDAA